MADRLQQVQRLLERALRLDAPLRGGFLIQACGGDEALLAEARSLLPHYEKMQEFEPPRPTGSLWRLPGTTTFANVAEDDDETAAAELTPPFCLGQYKIVQVLGRGGMGVVYRGVHATLKREVAIKLLRRGYVTSERRRQFALEIEILRRLRHSGIARLIDADTLGSPKNPRPYFVMEYIGGLSLTRYARDHVLGGRERMELLARVCAAVDFAHERGIVHCDLKPANILVRDPSKDADPKTNGAAQKPPAAVRKPRPDAPDQRQPKVLDFGIARLQAFEQAAAAGPVRFMGTPEYASPEQFGGEIGSLTPASDVYSLGLIAAELMTDELPRTTDGRLRLDLRKARLDPGADNPRDPEFQFLLGKVLTRALTRSPGARFARAGLLGWEFERLIGLFPAAPTGWAAWKNRVLALVSPQREWSPSSVAGPLRAITRARITGALSADDSHPPKPDAHG